jgi:hypothetical protein
LHNVSCSLFWWPLWNINIFSLVVRERNFHISHHSNSIHELLSYMFSHPFLLS